ncbi:hypothetical protein K438DRAFT_1517231, partial [Mycena galopus ATCC 62051]
ENMAELVWNTLDIYGLTGRVIAFMMDNATNNDTLVAAIQRKCIANGIKFSASDSRLRCMPHTVHLAVLQLLEAVGAVEKSEKKKKTDVSYQENVTASPNLEDDSDEEAVAMDEEDDEYACGPVQGNILTDIAKLRRIIRAVRSSPQRRQQWYKILSPTKIVAGIYMLILDVKT